MIRYLPDLLSRTTLNSVLKRTSQSDKCEEGATQKRKSDKISGRESRSGRRAEKIPRRENPAAEKQVERRQGNIVGNHQASQRTRR